MNRMAVKCVTNLRVEHTDRSVDLRADGIATLAQFVSFVKAAAVGLTVTMAPVSDRCGYLSRRAVPRPPAGRLGPNPSLESRFERSSQLKIRVGQWVRRPCQWGGRPARQP